MENFDKVEKLVQKTGISYEEARSVLEQSGGDLLDAMILLEQSGRIKAPKNSSYSTEYEAQPRYEPVAQALEAASRSGRMQGESGWSKLKAFGKKVWHFLCSNYLLIHRNGNLVAKLPFWGVALILMMTWYLSLVLVVVSLFFGFSYRCQGEKDMDKVNRVMEKARKAAENAKEAFEEET